MSHIIHFTPSGLHTLDVLFDTPNDQVNESLKEKVLLAVGLNAQLGVVIRLEDEELSDLSSMLTEAFIFRKKSGSGLEYVQILHDCVRDIAAHVWSEEDIEIG